MSSCEKAADKLVDIHTRWKAAEKRLGPAIEIIPQLLAIPVVHFVVGLFDSIFSSILGFKVLPAPVAAASALSSVFITGVVAFLALALLDASFHPESSPFQSRLSRAISRWIPEQYESRSFMQSTYSQVVQATHDDDTLDKAAAALAGTFKSSSSSRDLYHCINTLVHLLSPEASIRCNRTAAEVIVHVKLPLDVISLTDYSNGPSSPDSLLSSLAEVVRRSVNNRPLATLWGSTYIKACAIVVGAYRTEHPLVCILGSADLHYPTGNLLLEIFIEHFQSLSPDYSVTAELVELFEPSYVVPANILRYATTYGYYRKEQTPSASSRSWWRRKLQQSCYPLPARSLKQTGISAAWSPDPSLCTLESQPTQRAPKMGLLVIKAFLKFFEGELALDDSRLLAELCSTCLGVDKQYFALKTY
ncbi:hypothetical protein DFH09DRAFT_1068940 [Mycena vulgaris]|nr:hypothetical protein DFH09DRAFT_1068940 [Mycena vulgaris]